MSFFVYFSLFLSFQSAFEALAQRNNVHEHISSCINGHKDTCDWKIHDLTIGLTIGQQSGRHFKKIHQNIIALLI